MDKDSRKQSMGMSWGKFAAMILTSTTVMFPLMYQLVYEGDHVLFSINRLLASLVMGCVMTVIMLAFMWKMYQGQTTKMLVLAGGILGAILLLWVNRSQTLVGDVGFMKSMIPHHSIAINNASKATITDPRVRDLADKIIKAQVREIREMKLLIDDIEKKGSRGKDSLPPVEAKVTPDMEPEIQQAVK